MKSIILFIVLQILVFNTTYSQKTKIDKNYTQYFKEYSKNFKWNNFSFKTDYGNYVNDLIDLTDDEKNIYQSISDETLSDSLIIYKFNLKPIIQNTEFKDVFLCFGQQKDVYVQNLKFVKYFNNIEEVNNFYLLTLDNLSKKFGSTNILNQNNVWLGEGNLIYSLRTKENTVVFTIATLSYFEYFGSVKQKRDYYYTSDKFKEIDKGNSFRGIKFGTNLESLKSLIHLNRTTSNYEYITKDSKYLSWNSINFGIDGTRFGFTKDKKMSIVGLYCDVSDEEGYNNLKQKIIDILGSETYIGDNLFWSGVNLTIYMSKDYKSETDKKNFIFISSNVYKTFFEKDY